MKGKFAWADTFSELFGFPIVLLTFCGVDRVEVCDALTTSRREGNDT